MLVLTRRVGETLVIGSNVQVTVLAQKGKEVRLGIQAPRSISVDRLEVHERRLQEMDGISAGALVHEEILVGID